MTEIACRLKEDPILCDNFEKKDCFNCFWNSNSKRFIKHNICFWRNIYKESLEKLIKARRKIRKWKRKLKALEDKDD